MNYKSLLQVVILFTLLILFTSCGAPSYQDGNYEGVYDSGKDITNVKITIKDNIITECEAQFLDEMGNVKDQNYEKDNAKADYEKAQIAVKGMVQYPSKLVELGMLQELEAISGASLSYKEFKLAVEDALNKAE